MTDSIRSKKKGSARRPGRGSRGRSVSATILGYVDGIPIVPVTVERTRTVHLLHVAACPYCGRPHVHGGGRPDQNPRDFEGYRAAHCLDPVPRDRGYMLVVTEEAQLAATPCAAGFSPTSRGREDVEWCSRGSRAASQSPHRSHVARVARVLLCAAP